MKFYQFALKNLLRNRTRSVLTILSVVVATTTLFVVFSLDKGFKNTVKEELVEGVGAHLIVARGGCPMDAASIIAQGGISPMYIPESILDQIKNVKGVKGIMPFKIYALTTSDGLRTDIFFGVTEEVRWMKPKWKLKEGSWFKDENSVILGAEIARLEKRQVGDKIYVEHFGREFEVAGTLEYVYNQDDGFIFLLLATAQKLINREGKLSAIALRLENINEIDEIKNTIKGILPDDYMVLTPETIGKNVIDFFNSTRVIMFSILIFTLIVSSVGIANTMIMAIFERRKEFAYLKCIGAGSSDIISLVLLETAIICFIGTSLGVVISILFSSLIENLLRTVLLSGYISQRANIIRPTLSLAVLSSVIVTLSGVLAAFYPVIKTAGIMPMEALRNE